MVHFAQGASCASMSWDTLWFRASIVWLLVLIAGMIFFFFG
jgi:hypothetical protein